LLVKLSENAIEGVNCQHFADSGVVVQNHGAGILGTIVIAHANVRPADEGGVTEDDHGSCGPVRKPFQKT